MDEFICRSSRCWTCREAIYDKKDDAGTELLASEGYVPRPAHRAESDQGSASEHGAEVLPGWLLADHKAFEMFTTKPTHIKYQVGCSQNA